VALLAGAVTAAPLHAAVRTLSAAADNTLYQNPAGTLSNGAGPGVFVGSTSGLLVRRAVVRFDTAPIIPFGSTVNSAEYRLTLNRPSVGPYASIDIHRLTASWGEGASNASTMGEPGGAGTLATAGDATWIHRAFNTTTWSTPGGDFAPASASATPAQVGVVAFSSTALNNDVQRWIDTPTENFGWLAKVSDESVAGSAMRFDSREAGAAGPALVVNFRAGGDTNADDRVNIADFAVLAANFNAPGNGPDNGDFNRNGTVEIGDFSILAANFNLDLNPPRPAGVPEPSMLAPLVATSLLLRRGITSRRQPSVVSPARR
jgi:hypothetical protein